MLLQALVEDLSFVFSVDRKPRVCFDLRFVHSIVLGVFASGRVPKLLDSGLVQLGRLQRSSLSFKGWCPVSVLKANLLLLAQIAQLKSLAQIWIRKGQIWRKRRLDVDGTRGTLRVPVARITSRLHVMGASLPFIGERSTVGQRLRGSLAIQSVTNMPPRALVLHVTPMDDNRVSACDGTATMALVCRIILPSGAPHLDVQTDIHI